MSDRYRDALDTAGRLLGQPLTLPLAKGEPPSGEDFRRLATEHTFGDSWSRGSSRHPRPRLEAYAGAARAFDPYQIAVAVFGETSG